MLSEPLIAPALPSQGAVPTGEVATTGYGKTSNTGFPNERREVFLDVTPRWTCEGDLRHSALTHAAENGANTGTLLAYSGHASVASLARYTRVSPDALTRWQARRDPNRRA
ncbi:hypothetical protein ACBI99_19245 [Nonomuraea sp. ATR24]|uniref:hypothetical protein n=1 Tax=Nonomuraea sp. ATR24 TaxID=1676744 RepID=UPI0035BECC01